MEAKNSGPAMSGIIPPSGWFVDPGALRKAYRSGDPFRTLAAAFGGSVNDISYTITDQSDSGDDLERSRSIRRRSLATTGVLAGHEDTVERLFAADISREDIPKALSALGTDVDIDIAVELLHIPGVPGGQLEEPLPPRRLADKLSLLYITGKYHGIEPDYELALGKISLTAVTKLRELLHRNLPYRRLAEILAVIETTALAIRARTITTLAYADYGATVQTLSRRRVTATNDPADPWPVPASTLRRRFAYGFWEEALKAVGLHLVSGDDRFSELDYFEALDGFTEECIEFEYPMDIEIYDRWVIAETAIRHEYPSAVELIRRYGSWAAALESVLPPDGQEETEPDGEEPEYIDYDAGWGTLEELEEWEESLDNDWRAAGNLIGQLVEAMPADSFLHIQYAAPTDGQPAPYARATPCADGVCCEIVSNAGLTPHQWRLSTHRLSDDGWLAPNEDNVNWHKAGVPRADAATQILNGIRFGRVPVEASELTWSVGRVPDGSGPTSGVMLDAALRGVVQSVRNAS
jgi:hypothetical protein